MLKTSNLIRLVGCLMILIFAASFNLYADGSGVAEEGRYLPYPEMMGELSSYEWIERVQVGALDNVSGNDGGYGDYALMKFNAVVGNSVNITLTPGFSSGSYHEFWRVWVDFNLNGDFADPGEEVFSQSGSAAVSGVFTIPSSAVRGETRVRIAMRYGVAPPDNGVGFFDYGEVEDYTIVIEDGTVPNVIFKDISVDQAYDMVNQNYNNPDFIILDVRTAMEFSDGHLENAVNLDFYASDFTAMLNGLDKFKAYLVYCRSGNRSGQTMELMKQLGFTEAYNMLGGITAWMSSGYPVVMY